jgi:hypothetical protein
MFEHHTQPLLPRWRFVSRLLRSIALGLAIIAGSLVVGMWGYHFYEGLPWIDAFLNAAMILSGMGPLLSPTTRDGKLFAGGYALYSGFVVILATGIVFAPLVHRLLHRFHVAGGHHKHPAAAANHAATEPPGTA